MRAGKTRIGVMAGLLMAVLLTAGCNRDAAQDPLAQATTGPQSANGTTPGVVVPSSTPTNVVVVQVTDTPTLPPQPSPTPLPTLVPTVALPTPTASPTVVPGTGTTYAVKSGDRLFSIGRQFGVNPYSIAQANNILPPYIIHPGDVLKIPAGPGPGPGPGPTCPGHTVQRGDNLFRISLRYGKTVQAFVTANPGITNVNVIYIGQCLTIP